MLAWHSSWRSPRWTRRWRNVRSRRIPAFRRTRWDATFRASAIPHHRDVVARERPTDGCLRDFGRQALPPPCSSDPLSERRGSRIVKGQVRRADDAAVEHDGQLRLSGPVGLDGKGHEGFGVLLCRGEGHGRYVATEVLVVLVGLYIVNVAPSKGRRTSRSVTRESGRVRVRLRPDPPGGCGGWP
jgi:hypothetical protein